ncbi:MAG TPA: 2-C-methyl-D-erythritol 2,4-cyclodiphosphate synthase [Coriobacteriia bacterium]|nr:2-C-methyl-D-erythritol 2,4-cyclodiphosphate synthase [Coriobacteriia bacterium]
MSAEDTRSVGRIGLGYDVHAFAAPEDARPLVVGGVTIPHDRGLLGHSDADVLVHAVADALLGAARAGDIGLHFPDTDPSFAGADSLLLLSRVGEIVSARGWRIVDIDSVIIAQAPKMSPHRDVMRTHIASALGIDIEQVGVKATTTEHLGFTGREEGIAAQAVVLLSFGG